MQPLNDKEHCLFGLLKNKEKVLLPLQKRCQLLSPVHAFNSLFVTKLEAIWDSISLFWLEKKLISNKKERAYQLQEQREYKGYETPQKNKGYEIYLPKPSSQ